MLHIQKKALGGKKQSLEIKKKKTIADVETSLEWAEGEG